jgi:hypothetical protein
MRTSVKYALAGLGLAVAGGALLAGAAVANPGFGHHRMGMMGHGGPIAHEMLANLDTNDDGALSQEEIDAAVDARFTEFVANSDGILSLDEFQALWAEITRPMAVRAFQFLDPNGDAAVARAELDDRFGSVVARFDRNDDGMLSPADHRHHRGWHRWGGGDDNSEE